MINREYVGQISVGSGSFLYGLALDSEAPVYMDILATQTAVATILAALNNGKPLQIAARRNSATRWGDTDDHNIAIDGTYTHHLKLYSSRMFAFTERITSLQMQSTVLLHERVKDTKPAWAEMQQEEKSGAVQKAYLIVHDPVNAVKKAGQIIKGAVQIAVFPEWYSALVGNGRKENLVTKLRCYGGVKAYSILLDKDRWENLIQKGLRSGALKIPKTEAA